MPNSNKSNKTLGYQKKTILQVVSSLQDSKSKQHSLDIAEKLIEDGYRVVIISNGNSMVDKVIKMGAIHYEMNLSSRNLFVIWFNSFKIKNIIEKHNTKLIHVKSRFAAISTLMARHRIKDKNIKVITTCHGIYKKNTLLNKIYNYFLLKSNYILAVSKFLRDFLLTTHKLPAEKVKLIYKSFDIEYFLQKKKDITDDDILNCKEKYLISTRPVLLMPARFAKWKGHCNLIKALSEIKDKAFYCILVGDVITHPNVVSNVKKIIANNKMQNKIQIFGYEPNMEILYNVSDVIISNSNEGEAFNSSLVEAQIMEKLVVATDIGSSSELIDNGKNGFLVDVDDDKALVETLSKAIDLSSDEDNIQKYQTITQNALKSVKKKFAKQDTIDQTLALYKSLL